MTLQVKRDTSGGLASYIPAIGEPVFDLVSIPGLAVLRAGDGATTGGLAVTLDPATVLSQLVTLDTAAAGLDAGTLQGQAASAFAASVHNHHSSYFQQGQFVDASAGVADAGKPVLLGSDGLIASSMLPPAQAGSVDTVFGRTGPNIVASQGDYNTGQITNNSALFGTTLNIALGDVAVRLGGPNLVSTINSQGGVNASTLEGQVAADFAAVAHGHGGASGSAPGFMSIADKNKLDGIAAGAQVNPTDQAIFDAVVGLSLPGAGLNADRLDGFEASAFSQVGHGHTAFGVGTPGFVNPPTGTDQSEGRVLSASNTWVDLPAAGGVYTASSLGADPDVPVLSGLVGNDIQLKRLRAGTGVTLTDIGGAVQIDATGMGGGSDNIGANLGAGVQVYEDINGVILQFRSIVNGPGINWTQGAQTLTPAAVPGEIDHNALLNYSASSHLSGADRTKFDGIEAGAQVNPTASAILASLLPIDGAGTGLDADTVDGIQAAGFALAGHTHPLGGSDATGIGTGPGTIIFRSSGDVQWLGLPTAGRSVGDVIALQDDNGQLVPGYATLPLTPFSQGNAGLVPAPTASDVSNDHVLRAGGWGADSGTASLAGNLAGDVGLNTFALLSETGGTEILSWDSGNSVANFMGAPVVGAHSSDPQANHALLWSVANSRYENSAIPGTAVTYSVGGNIDAALASLAGTTFAQGTGINVSGSLGGTVTYSLDAAETATALAGSFAAPGHSHALVSQDTAGFIPGPTASDIANDYVWHASSGYGPGGGVASLAGNLAGNIGLDSFEILSAVGGNSVLSWDPTLNGGSGGVRVGGSPVVAAEVTAPADGHILVYNNTNDRFENELGVEIVLTTPQDDQVAVLSGGVLVNQFPQLAWDPAPALAADLIVGDARALMAADGTTQILGLQHAAGAAEHLVAVNGDTTDGNPSNAPLLTTSLAEDGDLHLIHNAPSNGTGVLYIGGANRISTFGVAEELTLAPSGIYVESTKRFLLSGQADSDRRVTATGHLELAPVGSGSNLVAALPSDGIFNILKGGNLDGEAATITYSPTPPANPYPGKAWYDTTNDRHYFYHGALQEWVSVDTTVFEFGRPNNGSGQNADTYGWDLSGGTGPIAGPLGGGGIISENLTICRMEYNQRDVPVDGCVIIMRSTDLLGEDLVDHLSLPTSTDMSLRREVTSADALRHMDGATNHRKLSIFISTQPIGERYHVRLTTRAYVPAV